MYWYVLFVQSGKEHAVKELIKKRLDPDNFIPFIPLQENIFRTGGKVKKELIPLFPGYVFVESELSGQEFIKRIKVIICNSNYIVSVLRYSDTEIAMMESERQTLLSLYNDEYCIESSTGIIEGDRLYISAGPLKGFESIIKKVNRHKRCAEIELIMMGESRRICLPLETVSKI